MQCLISLNVSFWSGSDGLNENILPPRNDNWCHITLSEWDTYCAKRSACAVVVVMVGTDRQVGRPQINDDENLCGGVTVIHIFTVGLYVG